MGLIHTQKASKKEEMERKKPGEGDPLGDMGGFGEEEKRKARIAVITNVATFVGIVVALRIGKGSPLSVVKDDL